MMFSLGYGLDIYWLALKSFQHLCCGTHRKHKFLCLFKINVTFSGKETYDLLNVMMEWVKLLLHTLEVQNFIFTLESLKFFMVSICPVRQILA